ncbi:MAG: hypothetical protein EHM72_09765 [Calditrichaeota bacterium]|nr:MAG: hypothetical protein EHM72_09765 [Calditrichota bacterium]
MRIRPIIMTSITTIFGLLPLAFSSGTGAILGKPLAVVLIGGLCTSTLLTLIIIPVIYCLFEEKKSP